MGRGSQIVSFDTMKSGRGTMKDAVGRASDKRLTIKSWSTYLVVSLQQSSGFFDVACLTDLALESCAKKLYSATRTKAYMTLLI